MNLFAKIFTRNKEQAKPGKTQGAETHGETLQGVISVTYNCAFNHRDMYRMWVDKTKKSCVWKLNSNTLQAHFEANQFVMTKKFKSKLRPDAIPTIFVHHPVVKKRRAPVPRCTPRPVNIQQIAADHSYSFTGDTHIISTNSY